jgi:tagatose-6-phosphate ketose/aldose isomerase
VTTTSSEDLAARGAAATWPEIRQQPDLWREVARVVDRESGRLRGFLDPLLAQPDLRVVLTGAGTSAFAGEVLAPALARTLGRRVEAVATTDIVSSPREVFAEDVPTLLVSFARSGDSPESVAATELAAQCLSTVFQLVITCNPDGRLARAHADGPSSRVLLMPPAANDRGFAMTSSFTSMLLAAWLVLAPPPDTAAVAAQVATAAEGVLSAASAAEQLVARGYERVVFLGSGALAGLARESALKLLELTAGGVVSYHDTALGFRHGPKSVLREGTLAVVYLSNDPYTRRYDEDMADELRQGLGHENVLVVSGRDDGAPGQEGAWRVEGVADVDDVLLALPFVVIAQLVALRFSLALGRTPDNPFPAGEVNRVVQGVTVHPLPA